MRLAYYAGASTAAAAACLLKAFHQRPNFYSATVYLSQSNACLLILTNLLLVLAASLMYGLQRLLYGPLRPIEIEQLSEKAWYAVLDTLLAMPSFREDVGGWLLAMFTLLLAGKVWGWIGEGRVDILEQGQPPANPKLFHARLATSLVLSVIFDLWMLDYCIETVLADPRPGMMVIFTFEFAIVAVFSIFTLARYGLAVIQGRIEKKQLQKAIDERKAEIRAERAAARQNETADGTPAPVSAPSEEPIEVDENEVDVPGWEEKRRYLFFLEVMTDFIKLMIYIVFFTVSITFNGLPMHIMRDVYMTFASFSKRVADYVAYKKATSDMNSRYPDATTEEIRGDACIVCRESMVAWGDTPTNTENQQQAQQPEAQPQQPNAAAPPAPTPTQSARRRDEGLRAKKLPCGHILHLRCLKAWLERQQVCPTCRRPVVVSSTGANATQQAGNPARGQQQAQQGQGGQQRQGRARILNLGPIRIGFLNGPGDQIGNLMRQMQHQNRNNNQNAVQGHQQGGGGEQAGQGAGAQQGPNHLGLQVPYANGAGGATGGVTGLRASVPTHIQLQQIEQRLMQEAQALGLEQQQLATLRAMEGHMAYLRTLQQLNQNQTQHQAYNPQAQAQQQNAFQLPQPQLEALAQARAQLQNINAHLQQLAPMGLNRGGQMFPQGHNQWQRLGGNPQQVLRSGDEGLPQGLVLPEGWSLMPLRRADAGGESANATASTAAPERAEQAQTQPEANRPPDGVPRDENGSPLFVPADTAATSTSASAVNGPATNSAGTTASVPQPRSSTQSQPDSQPQTQLQTQNDEVRNPWSEGGWSFVDPPSDTNGTNGENLAATSSNGAPKSSSQIVEQASSSSGQDKGKGKQPAVEDVDDEGT